MHELTTDLKHFLRGTTRRPGFTLTVVGILATGIAAATLVFSLVHALVLDPFPFPEPDRLVLVGSEMPRAGRELGFFERFSGPELTAILAASRTLRDPLPFDLNSVRVQGREFPLRLFAAFVAADPIPTLGLAPRLGRGFSADELRRAEPVALISHELWQSELGASPDILGQPLIADGTTYEIIGVLAPFASLYGADLFLPLTEPLATMPRGSRQLNLLARVVDGQTLAAVEAELEILAGGIAERHGDEHEEYCDWRLAATTWTEHNAFAYRDMALLALGAVLFVLLLVSTNLANLLLVRANAERGAMAVRAALGASRWRIVRLALIESTCLALLGGLGGVLLAHGGLATASLWLPATLAPSGPPAVVNSEILLFALAASLGSALVFGTAPALHTLRADPREALAEGSGRGTSGYGVRRVQRTLVAAQVALAIVLLTGAASLGSGLLELVQRDPGFDAEHLLSMRLSLPRTAYDGAAVPSFFAALTQDVGTLPGVEGVTVATQVAPRTFFGADLHLPQTAGDDGRPRPFHTVIGDDYFATLGIDILRGRPLDARDRSGGPCAMVVNEAAAQRFFPGREVLGQSARLTGSRFDSGPCEIVGVARTVRHRGLALPPAPEVFTSHRQAGGRYNQMYLAVRTTAEPRTILPSIRRSVHRLDPDQPVYDVTTGKEALGLQTANRAATAQLLTLFALAAVLLAALGIHGVVAFGIARRRTEISLRMALGATAADLSRLLVGESMRTVALGLLVGAVLTVGLSRILRGLLTQAADVAGWQIGAAMAALAIAALAASAWPAGRAGRDASASRLQRS